MASTKITIRVSEARSHVNVSYRTTGQVTGLQTAGLTGDLLGLPIPPKSSSSAWWDSILASVQAAIMAAE
jgi:hypothetical protein